MLKSMNIHFKYHLKIFRPIYGPFRFSYSFYLFTSIRNLDIEANKLYDRAHRLYVAALLTRCYTQHSLQQYIDSEIYNIRHFIKIQFVNMGIEYINLPSIFKDKSVISSIPTYFENKESPIICYKYNKSIVFFCLFLLLYVPCQQLWSLRDGQFT